MQKEIEIGVKEGKKLFFLEKAPIKVWVRCPKGSITRIWQKKTA